MTVGCSVGYAVTSGYGCAESGRCTKSVKPTALDFANIRTVCAFCQRTMGDAFSME